MINCPKWYKCSAPICPFSSDWHKAIHKNGDRICFWMIESVKPDAKANFEGAAQRELLPLIQTLTPAIVARWYPIKRALERASRTASRLVGLPRNKERPK